MSFIMDLTTSPSPDYLSSTVYKLSKYWMGSLSDKSLTEYAQDLKVRSPMPLDQEIHEEWTTSINVTESPRLARWVYSIGELQWIDQCQRREVGTKPHHANWLSPEERARVSAAWSAELRAKVAASEADKKSREVSVVVEYDVEDEPWCTWGPR